MESYTLPSFPPEYSSVHIALFEGVTNSPEIRKRLVAASITQGEQGDRLKAEVDYGFVEAALLVSKQHLLTAILTTLLYAFPSQPPSFVPSLETLSISTTPASSSTSPSTTIAPSPTPTPSTNASSSSSSPAATLPASASRTPNGSVKPKTRTHNLHSELLLTLSPNNNISDAIRRHGISDATSLLAVVRLTSPSESPEDVWRGIEAVVQGRLVALDQLEERTDWAKVDKIYKLSELNALKASNVDVVAKKRAAVVSSVAIKNVI